MLIETVLTPPEIDHLPEVDLGDAVCVVFDVLRATSSMITGLAHGTTRFYPVETIEEALALKAALPDAVLGGERDGDRIDGFSVGNSPLEYRDLQGKMVITTTTNGTIALRACAKAAEVYAAAFLNLDATIRHLATLNPARLVLVCAGTFRDTAFEDILAAGAVIEAFPGAELSDASMTALHAFLAHKHDLTTAFRLGRNGRVLLSKNRGDEIDWAARNSVFDLVAAMREGVIFRLD